MDARGLNGGRSRASSKASARAMASWSGPTESEHQRHRPSSGRCCLSAFRSTAVHRTHKAPSIGKYYQLHSAHRVLRGCQDLAWPCSAGQRRRHFIDTRDFSSSDQLNPMWSRPVPESSFTMDKPLAIGGRGRLRAEDRSSHGPRESYPHRARGGWSDVTEPLEQFIDGPICSPIVE